MSLPKSFEGKFEILHKISEGGMGAVYKVRHVLLDEVRVIKVVRPKHEDDENLKARFHREARTATRLRHPNIAVMHDFSIDEGGTAYIVMEFIDGKTLHEILRGSGPPPLTETLEIARQSLDALSYLHGQGYVHRDISPDNLMLTMDSAGEPLVKLIDLGVAKRVGGSHELTSTGMFLGKVRYSSPEQFGGAELDPRSDVYSFGVMLYELLTGRIPIKGEDFSSFIGGHLIRAPISFDVTDPEGQVPAGLRRVVMKTLEKKPENRVASAGELAELLAPYSRGAALHGTVAVDEGKHTVVLAGGVQPEGDPTSLPTGLVTDAMQRIDHLLDAGQLEEAERQLTATIGEVGEVEYLRGLRQKLERARAGRSVLAAAPRSPELAATAITQVTAADAGAPARPSRKPAWWAAAVVVPAIVAGALWWQSTRRPATVTVAVPIAEETYLLARGRIEAGDLQGVNRLLRQALDADPIEKAEHRWQTPGAEGPYLPHFYQGLVRIEEQNNCVLAILAWDKSERQGEVQKTAQHARLLAERKKCEEYFAEEITRLGSRIEQAGDLADLLESATTDPAFTAVWRGSPELLAEVEEATAAFRTLGVRFDQTRDAGYEALFKLEPDVADAFERLNDLTERVEEQIGG